MKNHLGLLAALVIAGLLYMTGLLVRLGLAHPWWNGTATAIGAAVGVVLAYGLFILAGRYPAWTQALIAATAVLFAGTLVATWYAAGYFVASDNFEWFAGQVWHKGYIALVALGVPLIAGIVGTVLRHLPG